MVGLIGLMSWFILLFIGIIAYIKLGRYLPPIPLLNAWNIKATIWEYRNNGIFPKTDLARLIKTPSGEWQFELKKYMLKTSPKSLAYSQKGSDGQNYIHMVQTSKDALVTAVPKFELVRRNKNGEEERVDLDEKAFKLVAQDENNRNWERSKYKENISIFRKDEGFMEKYGNFIAPFVLFLGMAAFIVAAVDPFIEITDKAIQAQAGSAQIQEANLKILDKLDRITTSLVGGQQPPPLNLPKELVGAG